MINRPRRSEFLVFGSPLVTEREVEAVAEVVRSCWIGTGPRVDEFENSFREYIGCGHAVALNSCTAALHLAMVASGIGPGDEVITTPLTFCATANAIVHTGATPVFADIDPATLNIDPDEIQRKLTSKTRAVVPVHFAGRPCDMDRIGEIARDNGLLVIEDAAHAIEAEFHGRKIGTIGAMTCFSFYVTKNLYTGEGGMVTTGDERLASTIKTYGLHGMTKDAWRRYSDEGYRHYEVTFPGFKYNMMDMQAALGLAQLPYLAERLQRRTEIWRAYDEAFAGLPLRLPPCEEPGTVHARHLYTLQLDLDRVRGGRDELMQALQKENIGTGVHYRSLHLQPYYRERFGFRPGDFPRAAAVSERVLSIPLSAKLTDDDVGDVIAAVTRCVEAMAV